MKKNSKKKTKYVEKIDAALKAKDERAEKAARRELKEMMLKNKQLIKARQAAEWGMRSLQGSFGRLKFPLDANDGPGRHRLVRLCCKLHQIRAQVVGISQIKNVYESNWREGSDGSYDEFCNMAFDDIRRKDRICKYYHIDL